MFGKKSLLLLRKNLIANPSTIKNSKNQNKVLRGGEAADLYEKEIPKVGSDYTCLAVILIDFVVKNNEIYYSQVFLKD